MFWKSNQEKLDDIEAKILGPFGQYDELNLAQRYNLTKSEQQIIATIVRLCNVLRIEGCEDHNYYDMAKFGSLL
jgi:hypothetical protein